jgi:hypothetical protein
MRLRSYHYLQTILIGLISTTSVYATTATPSPTPSTRTVKFKWNASPSPDAVGYKIFWGTGSQNYQNVRDVKNVLTTSLTLSQANQYYVSVIAYSMTTMSSFSNEVVVKASSSSGW